MANAETVMSGVEWSYRKDDICKLTRTGAVCTLAAVFHCLTVGQLRPTVCCQDECSEVLNGKTVES